MIGFQNFAAEADRIEQELQRMGVALGLDWSNDAQMRTLARAALDHDPASRTPPPHSAEAVRRTVFGLARLMLAVMEESAHHHIHTHGGPAWKALARALWAEHEARRNPAA